MLKTVFLALFIALLTFSQAFGFSVFGIKPNLALIAVIAASFFLSNIWEGFLLVALAALILKFAPGFQTEIFIFSLIGAVIIIAKNYLPWHHFLAGIILIIFGTIAFYCLLAPHLILSFVFIKELIINLVFSIPVFTFFSFLWQNK